MTIRTDGRSGRQDGSALLFVLAVVVLLIVLVAVAYVWREAARRMDAAYSGSTPAVERDENAAFVQAWSTALGPPFVQELATVPGRRGEFFALHNDAIYRFDSSGGRQERFAAPPKSSRIATDRTGALSHLLVVSSATKWTGAIDHVVTTDVFLHALSTNGKVLWTKRFDPKEHSTLEPIVARNNGQPMIVLSASKRILAFDQNGTPLWNLPFWHHPGTLAVADLHGDGIGDLLAAQAPKQQIMRIDADGKVRGVWGAGDGPSRLRTTYSPSDGFSATSLRQVFGRGSGVRHALMFFDYAGRTVREVELPPDASPLSYSPVTAMTVDASGRNVWIVALGDGSVHVYSPFGDSLTEFQLKTRPRTYLAVPQAAGADLLVVAAERGLSGYRPVAARMSIR